jgi:SAM-dependent methyltransferase
MTELVKSPRPGISRTTLLTVLQPWREVDEGIHRRLARLAEPTPEQETLWIGCGAGRSPLWWVERYGGHLHGVDADARAIEQAERAARQAGLAERVLFQAAEPASLPHEDQTFDLVVLNGLYVDAGDAQAVIGEAARVVRPMCAVVAIVPTWLHVAPVPDAGRLARLGLSPHQLVEWKQLFRDAGLVDLAVDDAAADGGWLAHGVSGAVTRGWRAARWRGLAAVLSEPARALRRLVRHRALGLALVKGLRWPHR